MHVTMHHLEGLRLEPLVEYLRGGGGHQLIQGRRVRLERLPRCVLHRPDLLQHAQFLQGPFPKKWKEEFSNVLINLGEEIMPYYSQCGKGAYHMTP